MCTKICSQDSCCELLQTCIHPHLSMSSTGTALAYACRTPCNAYCQYCGCDRGSHASAMSTLPHSCAVTLSGRQPPAGKSDSGQIDQYKVLKAAANPCANIAGPRLPSPIYPRTSAYGCTLCNSPAVVLSAAQPAARFFLPAVLQPCLFSLYRPGAEGATEALDGVWS